MNAILLIAQHSGLNLEVIKTAAEQLATPMNDISSSERKVRVRNKNYVETNVPLYSNNLFKEHFRMSRVSFEMLINEIGNVMIGGQNNPVDLITKIMFTIWMLAKPESFLSVGDRFGIAKSSGHGIFCEITAAIVKLRPKYVKCPNPETYDSISHVFEQPSRGFPNVIGAIDGCHIPCKQPTDNATNYYNRKGFHSIILQGVCDNKVRFIDICVGMPGRMYDARVFRNSPLYRDLMTLITICLQSDIRLGAGSGTRAQNLTSELQQSVSAFGCVLMCRA
ncbi:uncharacterized protein LOC143369612 [Andrena cerasifolii]|uniref:uncharacterized protein LOC143369612 n=1 Tax=Andrena cerasifolii TaxID=2819439 RepID=UPI00403844BB